MEKSGRLTPPLPPATALVEQVLRKSDEPLVTGNPCNNANEDLFLRDGDIDVDSLPAVGKAPRPGTAARRIIAKANTTLSPTNDNISEHFATSKNLATSTLQKRKNMVWNCKHLFSSEVYLIESYLTIMLVTYHRRREIQPTVPAVLLSLQLIFDLLYSSSLLLSHFILRPLANSLSSSQSKPNTCFSLQSSKSEDIRWTMKLLPALFVKNEIAKLEANLGDDNDLIPWSKEEESALERGLRRFSGPYWNEIFGLFGPNGSVSDVLKDRNEAQLDNKAWRMNISFLKSGVRFPFYLRMVNGDARRQRPR